MPHLTIRAATSNDIRANADFQTAVWREAYEGAGSQAYLNFDTGFTALRLRCR